MYNTRAQVIALSSSSDEDEDEDEDEEEPARLELDGQQADEPLSTAASAPPASAGPALTG